MVVKRVLLKRQPPTRIEAQAGTKQSAKAARHRLQAVYELMQNELAKKVGPKKNGRS